MLCRRESGPNISKIIAIRLVRFPSLPYMRCPTESKFQMDGSLAQDQCPSDTVAGDCTTTSRTVPTPRTVLTPTVVAPPVVSTWLLHRLLRPPQRQTVLHLPTLLPMPRIQQHT